MHFDEAYTVAKSDFDASRPWAVIANYRSFNRVLFRYSTLRDAQNRAGYLNASSELVQDLTGKWVRS